MRDEAFNYQIPLLWNKLLVYGSEGRYQSDFQLPCFIKLGVDAESGNPEPSLSFAAGLRLLVGFP